jgi:hypothetical protein
MPLFNDPHFQVDGEEKPLILEEYQHDFVMSEKRFPGMISAWATGKTMSALYKGYILSHMYPNNLGLILRKNFTDLRDSTMNDFEEYTGGKIKMQSKSITYENGSKILFHHADELAGVVQNINLGWFFIEQAEEFDNDTVFQKLRGRLRRKNTSRQGFIIANANGHNWCWKLWKQKPAEEFDLIEATTFDNKANLTPDFLKDLKEMEEQSPSHYRRFVMNSHEDVDTADRIVPYDSILKAVNRDLRKYDNEPVIVSCDPAEFGDDKTVIMVLKGLKVIDIEVTEKKELMDTAGRIVRMFHRHNGDKIIIDDIGVGAGVRSRLRELVDEGSLTGTIIGFNSGRSSGQNSKYPRLRDEMWMNVGQQFRDGYVSIPKEDDLIEELGAMSYSINSKGQETVARKVDIKKVLGRSTDFGDALAMGLWAMKNTEKRQPVIPSGREPDDSKWDPLNDGF